MYAQNERLEVDTTIVDNKYREDQFYAAVTYNLLAKKPSEVSQSGFSSGFHGGYIRDMPINPRRNLAIGLGIGLSTNSYNQTLQIIETSPGEYNYSIINDRDISFSKNKFSTYILEFPVQFRWRTSTATSYDFWRIYTGFKIGYVFYTSSKFVGQPSDTKLSNIEDFNKVQYGFTMSAGYDTINVYVYYSLKDLFSSDAQIDGSPIEMNPIKIGLIFYIL